MVRIVHAGTLLILVSVIQIIEFADETSTPKPMGTLFSMSFKEIERLQSLQSALQEYLVTCDKRETLLKPAVTGIYRMNKSRPRKKFSRITKLTTKISYVSKRTYPKFAIRRDVIYWHLVSMFSGKEDAKREILLDPNSPPKIQGGCYMQVFTYWRRHCFYSYYLKSGVKKIQALLKRACLMDWLNSTKIIRGLRSCCQSRFKYKKIRIF